MLLGRGQKLLRACKSTAGSAEVSGSPTSCLFMVLDRGIDSKPSVLRRWSPRSSGRLQLSADPVLGAFLPNFYNSAEGV